MSAHRRELTGLTVMCLIRRGDEIVVQKRSDPGWPGMTLPGGHVEYGESFTEAVRREVFEETGLTVGALHLCGVKNWPMEDGRYIVMLYAADSFTGSLASSDEGDVFWADVRALDTLDWASSMPETLKVYFDDAVGELFYARSDPDTPVLL